VKLGIASKFEKFSGTLSKTLTYSVAKFSEKKKGNEYFWFNSICAKIL
jgi:hypothetical protein